MILQQVITRGVNPMIQQWMFSVTTQQVNQFLPTITVQETDVARFIVHFGDRPPREKKQKKEEDATSSAGASKSPEVKTY